jgi:hypothetical protein
MAYTVKMYSHAPLNAFEGLFDYDTNAIKVALFSAYTPSQANDNDYTTIAAANTEVANGSGYTTGGATLGTKTHAVATVVTSLGAANASWTSASFTAAVAVVYDSVTSALLGYIDFGGNQTVVSGTFTIAWSGGIIATITVA